MSISGGFSKLHIEGDKIKKIVDSWDHYANERDIYLALGDKNYLVPFYDHCDNTKTLTFGLGEHTLIDYNCQYPIEGHDKCRILDWMDQVADGLMDLHDNGITHCDIKPENIVIYHGTARIIDFGNSSYGEPFRYTAGTYGYMSPSHYNDDVIDHTTDWWSFAVTLFETYTDMHFIPLEDRQDLDDEFTKIVGDESIACDVAISKMLSTDTQYIPVPLEKRLLDCGCSEPNKIGAIFRKAFEYLLTPHQLVAELRKI